MQLQGRVIGLDTAPLIYFIEQNETYLELVRMFFQAMSQGEFQVVYIDLDANRGLGASAESRQRRTSRSVS